ncbi:MAG: hypothetical protein GC153_12530 [Alphaproteobacteria bacterium]|nr:hypothetical protein [Alphaproteobacteria bacterium]
MSAGGARHRGATRAAIVLAAFWLAFVQALSAAHAVSAVGMAPNHDQSTCVFHIAGDRMHAASAPSSPVVLPVGVDLTPAPQCKWTVPGTEIIPLPPPRGPPYL